MPRSENWQERFWSKVDKNCGVWMECMDTPCWEWIASCDSKGYGRFNLDGRHIRAHRISYELAKGEIPSGLDTDHLCRNKQCVNPDHLEAITRSEHLCRRNGGNCCPNGHPYSLANTYWWKGKRFCKTCARMGHHRRWRESHAKV